MMKSRSAATRNLPSKDAVVIDVEDDALITPLWPVVTGMTTA